MLPPPSERGLEHSTLSDSSILLRHLAAILRAAADEADRLARHDESEHAAWIDQSSSPLGPRRHCAAVRARITGGLPGAVILGRRFLLSPEAVQVAFVAHRVPEPRPTPSGEEQLREALRIVGGTL